MTEERLIGEMHGGGDVAAVAPGHLAAAAALEVGRMAAAVQEEDRLLAALEGLRHRLDQDLAQESRGPGAVPQIGGPNRGERPPVDPCRQAQQAAAALL